MTPRIVQLRQVHSGRKAAFMSSSYIIRIYRRKANNPSSLAGIVEEVGVDGRRGFTCLDELWGILNRRSNENSSGEKGLKQTTEDEPDGGHGNTHTLHGEDRS